MSARTVCRYSCGVASACATKLALERDPHARIINAFIASEDADNRRFLADCEEWFGRPIVVLRDTKYGAMASEVWKRHRFIVSRQGAPCSKALKATILEGDWRPGDTIVLGYTADPRDAARLDRFVDAHNNLRVSAPLIDAGLTKRNCLDMVARAGIELPRMYRLGYHNANCPGCPKGGMGYWNRIRIDFPEVYEEMAALQDVLGPGSYFFRDRTTKERISLRALPPEAGRFKDEAPVECGGVCELPDEMARLFDVADEGAP